MTWVTMFLLRVALHLECVTVKRQKKKKMPGLSGGIKEELLFTLKRGYVTLE